MISRKGDAWITAAQRRRFLDHFCRHPQQLLLCFIMAHVPSADLLDEPKAAALLPQALRVALQRVQQLPQHQLLALLRTAARNLASYMGALHGCATGVHYRSRS